MPEPDDLFDEVDFGTNDGLEEDADGYLVGWSEEFSKNAARWDPESLGEKYSFVP